MQVSVPGRTLSEPLAEQNDPEVDLLSLDLEGVEVPALAGLDLERHAPRYVLLEAEDDARAAELATALGPRYRQLERSSPMDALFARID